MNTFSKKYLNMLIGVLILIGYQSKGQNLVKSDRTLIEFVSSAPLEIIQASSDKCQGILDLEKGDFAFRIYIKSFEGFNSPLQREHFFENYMEINEFPESTYVGKIIEPLNIQSLSSENYRAKGMLTIHGITREMIIPLTLHNTPDGLHFESSFTVSLADHNISIPTIVKQKIAEKIIVSVTGILK